MHTLRIWRRAPKIWSPWAAVLLAVGAAALWAPRVRAQAGVQGQWRTLAPLMPINPVHIALMNNGKVLIVAGSGNVATVTNYQAAVWDPASETLVTQSLTWDMFCNAMVALPDGRIFVNGGTLQYDPFFGQPRNAAFDPATGLFTDLQNMAHGRWYPTTTTLGDGRVLTFSGLTETGGTSTTVEFYTAGSGWSQEFPAGWTPPLYPRMHLLPNGTVLYSGSGTGSRIFNPSTRTWSGVIATTNYSGTRTYGTSVLLPLTPANGYAPRVMIMGGGNPATATTEIIDMSAATPRWTVGPPMSQPRIEMNATILPNGKVLAMGGSVQDEVVSTASLNADLYDPVTNTFSSAGANVFPRVYHSSSLLLPDATVLLMGGNPTRGSYEQHTEIYSPAYLFNANGTPAARPTIASVTPSAFTYGGAFQVQTTDAANIASVVLVRPGAATHAFDMDQRLVGLSFTAGTGVLNVTAPPNGNIAPPGYYMLFALNAAGVPSVASFVLLSSTVQPVVTMTAPANGATVSGNAVTVSANATDPLGISGVQFKLDGVNLGAEDTVAPYSTSWNSTAIANGSHALSAVARDPAGRSAASATVTVNVANSDAVPPTVSMTAPANGATVTGTVDVTASAADNAGVAGVQFLVDGVAFGAEVTSPPYRIAWDTTTQPTGSTHTLAARARDTSNNLSTLASVTVTVSNATSGPPVIDTLVWRDGTAAQPTIVSPAFSTAATNELILAFIAADYLSGTNTTVTSVTGAGLTWALVGRSNVQSGTSEIWRAFAPARLSAVTVTATLSQPAVSMLTIASFANVDTSGTNGSGAIGATASTNARPGAPSATLTTTRANSWIFGVGNDYDNASARTPGPNQVIVHQALPAVGDTYWVQRTTNPTAASGTSVTINDTAPAGDRYNLFIAEVRSLGAPDTTLPTVSMTAPASNATVGGTGVTVSATAADNVAVAGVQFTLDGANLGAEDTTSPYSIVWNSTAATDGTHSLTAVARDSAGNTATATAVSVTVSNADTTPPTVAMTAPANGATVSGSAVTVSASASDNVAVVGVQFLLDGVAIGSEVTASPYTMTWNSTGTSNTTHTLAARARDAKNNSTTSAAISVTVSNTASTPPVIDANVSADQPNNVNTVTTSAFSTGVGNELLLAFIATDYLGGANVTVTGVSGAGLTWQLVQRTNVQFGTSEIWRAFAAARLTNVTVTATLSQGVASALTVVSFSNVDTSGTNGSGAIGATASANAASGPPTATLVTTRSNSWVFGVGNDFDRPTARTVGSGQTLVHQYLAPVGDAYWVQRTTNAVPLSGTTVTINDTAPTGDRYNLAICEIRQPVP
jgi:hypothetical protein